LTTRSGGGDRRAKLAPEHPFSLSGPPPIPFFGRDSGPGYNRKMVGIWLLGLLGVSCLVQVGYAILTIASLRRRRARPALPPDPPLVSLLKPVMGAEPGLEANLESCFTLDYPRFEVLFAVDDINGPGADIIRSLQARYPDVPAMILEARPDGTGNPKVHKLSALEPQARGALFWVTDSNVRPDPDTLARLVVDYLRSGAKVVFSPIRGTGSRTFASLMENSSLNFFTSGNIIAAWKLFRRHILVGKSILIEARALRAFGGFGYLRHYLAEDFMLGEAFLKSGFGLSTGYTWITNVISRSTVRSFLARMSRWAKIRFRLRPGMYTAEVLLNPIVLGGPVLAGAAGLKVGLEYLNFLALNREDRRHWTWHLLFPAAVVAKDILLFGVYFAPFLSRRLAWRGGGLSIGRRTLILGPSSDDNREMQSSSKAWVVAVHMGLGHLRAAEPLRRLSPDGVIIYGSRRTTPKRELRLWRTMRRLYYASSQAGRIPVFGRLLLILLLALEKIPPYYPRGNQSRPTGAVRFLRYFIRRRGLCRGLREQLSVAPWPAIHTFYATAIALDDAAFPAGRDNYLLICDSDFNRVWVPEDPRASRIKYLAPCTQVKRRLLAYGVPEESIYLTGFPLPTENIGSAEGLEVVKEDLFRRLLRLDPNGKFFSYHLKSVLGWLGHKALPERRESHFQVMFAIGGAGAQVEMVNKILGSLGEGIRAGKVRLVLSCGIQKKVFERVLLFINRRGLTDLLENGISIIYDEDVHGYLDRFNLRLRETDVLWTKPSELAFYCGLGLPILMAPPIGTHEELNRRWLEVIHAGVNPPGPVEFCAEWLADLRADGRLAEAAWDGFLKSRKLGTYKIEELVLKGTFAEGRTPLEQ
jgi:hypothetical protein